MRIDQQWTHNLVFDIHDTCSEDTILCILFLFLTDWHSFLPSCLQVDGNAAASENSKTLVLKYTLPLAVFTGENAVTCIRLSGVSSVRPLLTSVVTHSQRAVLISIIVALETEVTESGTQCLVGRLVFLAVWPDVVICDEIGSGRKGRGRGG